MKDKIRELQRRVCIEASNKKFIHHKWFVRYHLEIVHQISMELCEVYPEANTDVVETIVWLHDYGKILDFDDQETKLFIDGRNLLIELGFNDNFVDRVLRDLKMFERKMELDLSNSPIEVKITSSADAASHFFGPFFFLWWYENPEKDFEALMKDNAKKAAKDWNRKIVLPEVKELIDRRYKYLLEQSGNLPLAYLVD